MIAVYKREVRSYFNSMTGYIFAAAVTVFIGIFFMVYNLNMGYPYFGVVLTNCLLIMVIAVPILTMRSMAEERKTKTDQMLMTYPVTVASVVVGKFLSMMTVVMVPIGIAAICPLIIALNGTSHLICDYSTILAFIFLSGMLVSIGMFISSTTENQIISAILTFAVLLLLYWWDSLVAYLPISAVGSLFGFLILLILLLIIVNNISHNNLLVTIIGVIGAAIIIVPYLLDPTSFEGLFPSVLGTFSCTKPLNNFGAYNVFDLGGLFFYLSVTVLFIFLTVQNIQKRRWN